MEKVTDHPIQLRPLFLSDFSEVLTWSRDNRFCEANEWPLNRDQQELEAWWKKCVHNTSDTFIRLGIEFEHRLIGYVDFADYQDKQAELGIAIGDSKLWQRGLGSQSLKLAMKHGREHLGITTFLAETNETNVRARKMLKTLGFEEQRKSVEPGTETQLVHYIKLFE